MLCWERHGSGSSGAHDRSNFGDELEKLVRRKAIPLEWEWWSLDSICIVESVCADLKLYRKRTTNEVKLE